MNDFLIRFSPPRSGADMAVWNSSPLPKTLLHLPYAQQGLLRWGAKTENFVHQQFYRGSDFAIAVVDIEVNEATLLELTSSRAFNGLQYTLEGCSFGGLAGYGCLPLFKDTYTLQYIPQGRHTLLLPRGRHSYFYIHPGKLLDNLQDQHQQIRQIAGLPEAMATSGRLITRLPVTNGLRQLINGFMQVPDANTNTALLIESSINTLIRYYHNQVLAADKAPLSPEQMMVFLAQHLHLPVPQLLTNLKRKYFIEKGPLLYLWKKYSNTTLRDLCFYRRMEYALYLLATDQRNVKDTASLLSYSYPNTFSAQFTKYWGFTPALALSKITR